METESNHSTVSKLDESFVRKYEIHNENKIDIDKSDPDDEKCYECVEFFDICPEDFVKLGMINYVISEIENKDEKMKDEVKNSAVFDKLSITLEEEILETSDDEVPIKSKTINTNYKNSFKKFPKIPTITITNHENEMKSSNEKKNDEINPINGDDCTINCATIIADKVTDNVFNFDDEFIINNKKVNILSKCSDLEEIPLSLSTNKSNNEKICNKINKECLSNNFFTPDYSASAKEVPNYYDYQPIVNNNIITTNLSLDKIDDSLKNVTEKQNDKSVLLESENSDIYNNNNINCNDSKQLEYNFNENYARAVLRQHESFRTARDSFSSSNSLSDEERIKTVITLKSNGFSDILNVNHCIDCILERTLKANPFYHAQPERLSVRCNKCKPCARHSQTDIDRESTIESNLSKKEHDCACEDICKEVNCSMCSTKIPLCKNLEHERSCTDKYSAPVPMPNTTKSENNVKFLRSDSHEMIEIANEGVNNTTVERDKHINYTKPKKSWFKKIISCNSCKSGKRKIYNQK